MAQPGRVRVAASTLKVTLTYNPAKDEWKANPPNPSNGAKVDNQGQVTFHCVQSGGCRVYTSPGDAFVNETNGYEQLGQGDNTYTLTSGVDDSAISYCICGPAESCMPTSPRETGGYSIQAGNPTEGGRKKK
jgi:hypothetical protein